MTTPAKLVFFEPIIIPNIIMLKIKKSGLNISGRILCKYITTLLYGILDHQISYIVIYTVYLN